ncbi:LysR family transcriptional regulator [Sphingobium sp. BHU LFT2]|uniref:LysR family transcriptional regulator n=1 Tax=Sphingobium sp. BHU LFT2 TaxID=2807634 RepID=UPI001BE9201B|nr:LysR family transcriptional regulator [Sphingobium sp. BHU LFT2]MBT2246126.1 LysR family transcriptional regulator [Sphingobium sp. BHU LFT2]
MASDRPPLLPIKQLRTIVAIAEQASLARASQQLNLSQSSLSRQVAEAERQLGHRLFQRGWNGTEPTSAGAVVIAHARRMMTAITAAQKELQPAGTRGTDLGYHLSWFLLDAVDAVRTTGSASGAAARLGVSQPTISRTLAQANAAVGHALFTRNAAGMAATPSAAILRRLRDQLHNDADRIPGMLGALTGEMTGRIAVGLLPFSEQDVIVQVFAQILRDHPHVRLQGVTGSYAALTDALRRGEIDFIIGPLRGSDASATLAELPLLDEHLTIVAHPGHALTQGPVSLEQLVDHSWIVGPHGTPTRQYFEAVLLEHGMTPPLQICEMVTFPLAERMVLESDAIGLLTYSARQLRALTTRLAVIPSDFPDAKRQIGVISLKRHAPSEPQALFLQKLTAALAQSA